MKEKIEPKIIPEQPEYSSLLHDGFWYDKAKELVDKAPDNINESAGKFETLVLWLWGIYTTIVGLGAGGLTVFAGMQISNLTLAGLISPSLVLLVSYWLTTAAKTTAIVKFEHRSPEDIRNKYNQAIEVKSRYYKLARLTTLLACALIPVTIFIGNKVKSADSELFVAYEKSKEGIELSITGNFPEKTKLNLLIKRPDKKELYLLDLPKGNLNRSFTLPSFTGIVEVSATWKESEEREHKLIKKLEIKE
jgi:hypothetical protein